MRAADWSRESTFRDFYCKPIDHVASQVDFLWRFTDTTAIFCSIIRFSSVEEFQLESLMDFAINRMNNNNNVSPTSIGNSSVTIVWSTDTKKQALKIWNLQKKNFHSEFEELLSPLRSITTTIVDSAYSSFSGSSYVPDYQTSYQGDSSPLDDEQLSYMDSEYVKAIYNPNDVEHGDMYQNICSEYSSSAEFHGKTASRLECDLTSYVCSPEPQSSPPKWDNYVTHQNDIQSNGNASYVDHLNQKLKWSPPGGSLVSASNNKAMPTQRTSPTWVNTSNHGEVNQDYKSQLNMKVQENNYFTKSTFAPQSDSVIKKQDALCFQNPTDINNMNKDHYTGIEIQTNKPQTRERSGSYHSAENHLQHGQYISELSTGYKSTRRSLNEIVSEKLSVSENKGESHCYSSEGTKTEEVGELAANRQYKAQKPTMSHSTKDTETENLGQWDTRHKWHNTRASGSNGDLFTQPLRALNLENEIRESNKTQNLKKDATIKPIPLLSQQLIHDKSKSHPLCDLTSEKITKETTPMLFHLARGRNMTFIAPVNGTNQTKQQELSVESKAFQDVQFAIPQPKEAQRDVKQLPKNNSLSQLADHSDCGDGDVTGSFNSATEEFLMNDYREKLKIAQKKVLRETSFKRKDLQMSLPGRLKLNPPKRPSIDHFRSYSLSSANEETNNVQTKSSFDTCCRKEELEKLPVPRIGGRKRITKEQRKLCYSEPEKLDHLGIQNSGFAWKEQSAGSTQNDRSDSGVTANRIKFSDNKERTLSSSNLSKTELKQIQHNALIQYMERKTNQRPSSIQQANMQRTSWIQTNNEWNCNSVEIMSNEVQPKYLQRRSDGASSSYDATVTWNDRFVKTSPLRYSLHSMEQTGGSQHITYLDQQTLEDNQECFEDSPPSVCQKIPRSTHLGQASNGCAGFSGSAFLKNPVFDKRLTYTDDRSTAKTEQVCAVRGRGKSMEEIGTTEVVKLSVLSQSTDQLYHMKGPVMLPKPENTNAAVDHQDKLQASAETESGKIPRQTSEEDILGPHISEVANSARMKHSRPSRTSAVSSGTENNCSPPPSEAHPTAPEKKSRMPLAKGEESASSLPVLPDNVQSEQQSLNESTASFISLEEDLSGHGNEMSMETSDLSASSAVSNSLVSRAQNQDLGAGREEINSTEPQLMSSSQREEVSSVPSCQVTTMQTSQSSFGQTKHDADDEVTRQESEENVQKSNHSEREAELPRVKLKSPEDERREELVKAIIAKDKSLADSLEPLPARESAMDLMKSLFPIDISAVEKSRNRRSFKKDDNQIHSGNSKVGPENSSKLPSKIVLLLQKSAGQKPGGEYPDDITSKKIELISSLSCKLEDLCEQRELLLSEINENTTQGNNLEAVVKEVCKPNEYERYMMFIGDLEKVVSLLFCLSMRLSRVENALTKIDDNTDAEEKQSLKERHSLLSRQKEDAKDLKENLDRRERVVTGILARYLNEHQLQDYKHFVRLKTSFLIEQKDLDEKIKLYEEQLQRVHNSIPP
ncbi:protein Shroom1 [Rhinophrynus dorsalis]